MKAYTTRVGEGPLPTESPEIADMLHAMGREFGATTGRARRCGWFDSVATRHAQMVNGIDELAVTNVDGLDSLDVIRVVHRLPRRLDEIRLRSERHRSISAMRADLRRIPRLENAHAQNSRMEKTAGECRSYLKAIAELTGAKLSIVSVGPVAGSDDFR